MGSDELQKTPERIDAYIQGKYFVTCVSTLNSSLKKLDGGECTDIGALANVKQELFAVKKVCSLRLDTPEKPIDYICLK